MSEQVSQLPKVDALMKECSSKALFAFSRCISWADKNIFPLLTDLVSAREKAQASIRHSHLLLTKINKPGLVSNLQAQVLGRQVKKHTDSQQESMWISMGFWQSVGVSLLETCPFSPSRYQTGAQLPAVLLLRVVFMQHHYLP